MIPYKTPMNSSRNEKLFFENAGMNLRSFFSPEVSINCHWKITLSVSVSGRKLEWTNPHRANIAKIEKRFDQRNEGLFSLPQVVFARIPTLRLSSI